MTDDLKKRRELVAKERELAKPRTEEGALIEPSYDAKLRLAGKHSCKHREEIEKSSVIVCYYCQTFLKLAEIKEWVDKDQTAVCPYCGIDTVLGNASGMFLLTTEFVKDLNYRWFGRFRREP